MIKVSTPYPRQRGTSFIIRILLKINLLSKDEKFKFKTLIIQNRYTY
jgi:hypothetical protein